MARYGVPYRGSKSTIAPWVVENLPRAKTLVDLFAGGCVDEYQERMTVGETVSLF